MKNKRVELVSPSVTYNNVIDEDKIVKEVEKVKKQLEKDNYYLTTKGMVSIIVNLIEEQR